MRLFHRELDTSVARVFFPEQACSDQYTCTFSSRECCTVAVFRYDYLIINCLLSQRRNCRVSVVRMQFRDTRLMHNQIQKEMYRHILFGEHAYFRVVHMFHEMICVGPSSFTLAA
jgi:hypothetical protein